MTVTPMLMPAEFLDLVGSCPFLQSSQISGFLLRNFGN